MNSLANIYLILCYFISHSIGKNLLPIEVIETPSAVDLNQILNNDMRKINSRRSVQFNLSPYTSDRSQFSTNQMGTERNQYRILYKVGQSEEDLPICGENQVCSKIDVYDTPWIERQCRCPMYYPDEDERLHLHRRRNHHHHHHHQNHNNQRLDYNGENSNENSIIQKDETYLNPRHYYFDTSDMLNQEYHEIQKPLHKEEAIHRNHKDIQTIEPIRPNKQNKQNKQNYSPLFWRKFRQIKIQRPINSGSDVHRIKRESNKLRHTSHLGKHHKREQSPYHDKCSTDIRNDDGYTISDKTRHYKLCKPVDRLRYCDDIIDYTWTLTTNIALNVTRQIVHCKCRPNSVTFLTQVLPSTSGGIYLFACSPRKNLTCVRKQPCKLFTVRQRQSNVTEVDVSPLCQCPMGHKCPSHHTNSTVIPGESNIDNNDKIYIGYCTANRLLLNHL